MSHNKILSIAVGVATMEIFFHSLWALGYFFDSNPTPLLKFELVLHTTLFLLGAAAAGIVGSMLLWERR